MKIFFFLICISLYAQEAGMDTLLKRVDNMPDSSKVKYLNDYAWNNRSKNPRLSLASAREALRLAEIIGNKKLQSTALNFMGVIYRNLGEYDTSLKIYTKALNLAEEVRDSSQIAYALNNIGGIYRLEGNNKIALEYILKALGVFERRGDKQGMSYCTLNIGLIYRRLQDYIKSLEYLNYTLKIRNEIGDRPGQALALNQIAEVNADMGNIETALKYYYEVEKQYQEIDDKKGLAAAWGGLGGIFLLKNDLKEAIAYRTRALEMSKKINYLEGLVTNYNNLGKLNYLRGNAKEAEKFFDSALKIALGMKEIYVQLECYRFLSDFYEHQNDSKRSAEYIKKYYTLRDSATRKETVSMIYQFEASRREMKNEIEKSLLQKENELQRKQATYLLILVVLIVGFLMIIYSKARATRKLNKQLNELISIKDKLFHIIAHDLKNPFSSLLGFTEILEDDFSELNDEEKLRLIKEVRVVIKSNFHLLENLLNWAISQRQESFVNKTEINLYQIITEIESLFLAAAKNKKLKIDTNVPEDTIVYADPDMLRTILRNLLSNAIKFSKQESFVTISAAPLGNMIEISVKDSGVGIEPEKLVNIFDLGSMSTTRGTEGEKGTGLGLILCKEFVEKNGGTISVESEIDKGTRFFFTLPVK